MALNKQLLEILACPKCKGALQYIPKDNFLVCYSCKLKYPIKDDIPIMLIDEAISFEQLQNHGDRQ